MFVTIFGIILVTAAIGLITILTIDWFLQPKPKKLRPSAQDITSLDRHPYRTAAPLPPSRPARQMRVANSDDDTTVDDSLPTTTPHLEQMRTLLMTYTSDTPDTSHHHHTVCPEAPAHSSHDTGSTFDHGHCSTDSFDGGGGGGFDGGGHHH